MITITLDQDLYRHALSRLDPKAVDKAARMAVNEAARAAKSRTSDEILKKWNIKRKDLESKFTVRPSGGGLTRTLSIGGPPIGLAYFGATEKRVTKSGVITRTRGKDKQLKTTKRKSKQTVSYLVVEILKGKRTFLSNAFLANPRAFAGKAKGGAVLYGEARARVLARVGEKKADIIGPKSISVASMFQQGNIEQVVTERASDVLSTRFRHHVMRQLAG